MKLESESLNLNFGSSPDSSPEECVGLEPEPLGVSLEERVGLEPENLDGSLEELVDCEPEPPHSSLT